MQTPGATMMGFGNRPVQWRPAGQRPTDERAASRTLLNELAAKFPLSETIAAGFTSLTIPATPVPGAADAAWFSLVNIDPVKVLGQEIVTFGLWLDMLSTDPDPEFPLLQAAWGDAFGLGAAIVIGQDLPVGPAGTWSVAPPPVSGIDAGLMSVHTNQVGRKHWSRSFPTGERHSGPQKRGLPGSIVPFVRRITEGHRLCAAFVLNRTQFIAGNGLSLGGLVDLEIYYGLTQNVADLRQ